MPMTPEQRKLRAQLAANIRWSRERDRVEATRVARDKFNERFINDVDPNRELDPGLRSKLAENARTAYFQRLALKSSRARQTEGGPDAAA